MIALLRQLAAGAAAMRDESAYWRLVLHYCRQGNLQAVLDEQWHLLWEQDSWSEDASPDETAGKCARKLVQVVHPAPARVHAEFFRAEQGASGATVERDEIRVRTVFALRFGHVRTDDGDYISQDAVRAAFNSPFRPFVLTSTSIGQEGLDFHPCATAWSTGTCRAIRWISSNAKAGFTGTRAMPFDATWLPPMLTTPSRRGTRATTSGR